MPTKGPSRARQLLFSAILGAVVLGVTLGLAELSLWAYFTLQRDASPRFIHHENKSADDIEREIDHYLEVRHPVLGWAPQVEGGSDLSDGNALHFDASGSRYSPAFPESGGACISVYGDSFALGQDVGDEEAWTNQLARLAGCRVANYGMNGYGIDQAVLRAEETTNDEATVAVLSIYPSNVLRSLTHQVGFVVMPGTSFQGLKPRFVRGEDSKLTLKPIPYTTREQLRDFTNAPVDALGDDWFNPRGYWARLYLVEFPYTRMAWRIVTGHGMRRFIHRMSTGMPIDMDYYQPGHPSGSLELAGALAQRFRDLASARGQRVLFVLLPDPEIMRYFAETGEWAHGDLLAELGKEGDPVLNAGAAFDEHLEGRPYQTLESHQNHFNADGYRILAEAVHEIMVKEFTEISSRR